MCANLRQQLLKIFFPDISCETSRPLSSLPLSGVIFLKIVIIIIISPSNVSLAPSFSNRRDDLDELFVRAFPLILSVISVMRLSSSFLVYLHHRISR